MEFIKRFAARKINYFPIIVVILIAAFLRLYHIREYIVFLGDEGRDALVWQDMVFNHKFTLLGPTASVGGFFLGPIYYYFTLPFYWAYPDPVGPAIFIALIGVATVWLIWFINKKWFGPLAGLFSAWTCAVASLILRFSRSSWNPNPLPFFSLLGYYWVSNGINCRKKWQILGAGICLGIAWQLHYLALILTPVYLAILFSNTNIKNVKKEIKSIIIYLLIFFLGWIIGFSPFIAFEARHNFPNTKTILEFITRKDGRVLNFNIISIGRGVVNHLNQLYLTVTSWPENNLSQWIIILILIGGSWASIIRKRWHLLIFTYLSIIIFSLYQGNIENYYYGFLFPIPFILAGAGWELLISKIKLMYPLAIIGGIFFALNQSNYWFLNNQPNNMIQQTEKVAMNVISFSENQPYNFALITNGNSDHAYRYFLEKLRQPPIALEQYIANQLLVICEKPEPECQPLGNPIWEIAGFGRAEIIEKKTIPPGITIYRLTHYTE